MPIYVVQSGAYKAVTRAYSVKGGAWKEVLLGQYAQATPPGSANKALVTFYDRFLTSPTGVRGINATYSSATITWDAVPQATGYQVLRTDPGGAVLYFPSSSAWTSELSYPITGLAQNSTYQFTVRARRVAADGTELISSPSSAIRLNTGYPAVTNNGSIAVAIYPSRSASYTTDGGWSGGNSDVVQGNTVNASGAISRGAIAYNTAKQQLDAALAPYALVGTSTGVTVNSASIRRIHRRNDIGGASPTLNFYGARCDFSGVPAAATGAWAVTGPAQQNNMPPLAIPLDWARAMCQFNLYTPLNGLMLYTNDGSGGVKKGWYNQYCVLDAAVGDLWLLDLGVSWSFTTPGVAPAWT